MPILMIENQYPVFDIEGYAYKFSTWSTIEEAMESIGEKAPER